MSRELKFRAWDEKDGEMFYSNIYQDKTSMAFGLGNFLKECSGVEVEDTLMQFTGYYAKNGEEIYEGDILSTPYYGNLQVIFSQHSGGWIFHPIDKNAMCSPSDRVVNDLYHLNYSKDVDEIVDYFNRDNNSAYFVIGNIHQNPELLECK